MADSSKKEQIGTKNTEHNSEREQSVSTQLPSTIKRTVSGELQLKSHNEHPNGHNYFFENPEWWLVIVTAVLVWVTARLVKFTKNLWNATDDLVNDAKRTAERGLRAYVGANTASAGGIQQDFSIQTKMKNNGQTPAYRAHLWNELMAIEHPLPEGFKFQATPEKIDGPRYVIQPGAEVFVTTQPDATFTVQEVQDIMAGRRRIYIWGEIRYDDAFRHPRHTWFRLYWQAGATGYGTWIFCEEGNEAD